MRRSAETWTQSLRTVLAVVATAGLFVLRQAGKPPADEPPRLDQGERIGRSYAPYFLKAYARAWDAAADSFDAGKSVAESQGVLQETWKQERLRLFNERVRPEFSKRLPEGMEPGNAQERAEIVAFWRSFARGLRMSAMTPPGHVRMGRSRRVRFGSPQSLP